MQLFLIYISNGLFKSSSGVSISNNVLIISSGGKNGTLKAVDSSTDVLCERTVPVTSFSFVFQAFPHRHSKYNRYISEHKKLPLSRRGNELKNKV